MNETFTYTFRMSRDERQMVRELAKGAYRADAEVIRVIIRGAYEALQEREAKENANKKMKSLKMG